MSAYCVLGILQGTSKIHVYLTNTEHAVYEMLCWGLGVPVGQDRYGSYPLGVYMLAEERDSKSHV